MMDAQEVLDTFYFSNGKCCAGCDWWQHINSRVGDCTKSSTVSSAERWDMLGMSSVSLRLPSGHIMTKRDHKCDNFKDEFDWSQLPLVYRNRVGAARTNTGSEK
jgi:hypothetical protein